METQTLSVPEAAKTPWATGASLLSLGPLSGLSPPAAWIGMTYLSLEALEQEPWDKAAGRSQGCYEGAAETTRSQGRA